MKKGVAKKATKSVKSVKQKAVATSSTSSKSTVKKVTKKKVSKKKKPSRFDDSDSGCSGSLGPVQSVPILIDITSPTKPINSDSLLGVKIGKYNPNGKVIEVALQGTVPPGITIGSFGFRVTEEKTVSGEEVFVAEYSFAFTRISATNGSLTLQSSPQIPTDLKVTVLTKKKIGIRFA